MTTGKFGAWGSAFAPLRELRRTGPFGPVPEAPWGAKVDRPRLFQRAAGL